MKIAILSALYPLRGGMAQVGASLYRALEREGHTVLGFTFSRQYPEMLFPGQTQYVTPEDGADPIETVEILDSINPLSYRKTAKRIARFAPDLLVVNYWMPFFAPAFGYVAGRVRTSGAKVISLLHNIVPHERRPGDRLLTLYFLRRNDAFLVLSKSVESDLRSLLPGAICTYCPHPVFSHFGPPPEQAEARAKLGIAAGRKVLLFFGFIRPYKGLDVLIRALSRLPEEYLLLIAGEMYGDFRTYQKIIDETETAEKIKLFVRYINDTEVPLFFAAADVNVLPYTSATQSGIAQIASHFNLPQIVTDVGGLAEAVQAGETGLIVSAPEPGLLAEKIRLYFERGLKSRFVAALKKRRGQHSWSAFSAAVLDLYDRLQGNGAKQTASETARRDAP